MKVPAAMTDRAQNAIRLNAPMIAKDMGHAKVGTGHLLIALLEDNEALAIQIAMICDLKIDIDKLKTALTKIQR